MPWELTTDLDRFTAVAGEFLRSRPIEHTNMLTVSRNLKTKGPLSYGPTPPLFGWWRSPSGAIEGALLQTPPRAVLISSIPPEAAPTAATALYAWPASAAPTELPAFSAAAATSGPTPSGPAAGSHLGAGGPSLSGVNIPADAVEAFVAEWLALTGAKAHIHMRVRVYRLAVLTPLESIPEGRARVASNGDRELLTGWYRGFHEFIGEPRDDYASVADDWIASGRLILWEVDGKPVSMASRSAPASGMSRISLVWTPPEQRRNGFAGAATTAAARAALEEGVAEVVLNTDLDNPTSNALYQRLGFRPVEDRMVVEFS